MKASAERATPAGVVNGDGSIRRGVATTKASTRDEEKSFNYLLPHFTAEN